ncbi:unnamed protein product, partial [Adineta ricciae]
AIASCVQLICATLSRILAYGFNNDLTALSLTWCKIKQHFVATCYGISVTCFWLATLDQFLITSRAVFLRRLSRIEWAHRIAAAVIVLWMLQDVPFYIFVDIRSNVCGIYNSFWQTYNTYVCFWFLYMTIPIVIMIIFGSLAYRNLRGLTSVQLQGADQQLTLIICGQIATIIITVLPTCIYNAYSQITITANKSAEQKSLEFFIANIISFLAAIGLGVSE